MEGIDYTSSTTAVQAKALKDAGYGFVCRYLVPARMAWKRLTKPEADIISVAGLQIVSVYEASANNAVGGAAQGYIDGKEALAEAKIVGQPEGSTIYFAVDYDAQPNDYNAIEAYLKAVQAQITGYFAGVYGSYSICEEMFKRGTKYCWQTYAWSAGKKSSHANVYQYHNGANVCGISCDKNESFGSEGFWTVKKSIDEIVKEVINGKWGNGDVRKKALAAAGYDIETVQARVNQLLNTPVPKPALKSIDVIAKEVIAGKWGVGLGRKSALNGVGYNANDVQARVNQLLSTSVTKTYKVKHGDTLSAIATANKTTVAKLVSLNGIKNPNMISIGQIIKIE